MLSSNEIIYLKTSILGTNSVFFTIGGTLLVVMAGIWAFRKVKNLLEDAETERGYQADRDWCASNRKVTNDSPFKITGSRRK